MRITLADSLFYVAIILTILATVMTYRAYSGPSVEVRDMTIHEIPTPAPAHGNSI